MPEQTDLAVLSAPSHGSPYTGIGSAPNMYGYSATVADVR